MLSIMEIQKPFKVENSISAGSVYICSAGGKAGSNSSSWYLSESVDV